MKTSKNIEDLFRENAHKLDERPPERIWRRLDERIEESGFRQMKKKPGRRKLLPVIYRMAAVAATVLILISLVTRFLMLPERGGRAFAMAEPFDASRLEDLVSDASESAALIGEVRLLYASYPSYRHPIALRAEKANSAIGLSTENGDLATLSPSAVARGESAETGSTEAKSLHLSLLRQGRRLYIILPELSQPLVLKPEGSPPLNFYPADSRAEGMYLFKDEQEQISLRWFPAADRMEIESSSADVLASLQQQLQPFFVLEGEHLLIRQPLHQDNHD